MMTGGLVACDWLRPVMRGAWRVAPLISVVEHADVRLHWLDTRYKAALSVGGGCLLLDQLSFCS